MKILVTGGAGFIGSNFIARTIETRGFSQVTVLDSVTQAGAKNNLYPFLGKINFVQGDIRDSGLTDKLISESDLVVHFAAESHNDNSLVNPNIFFETNVMGTLNIANSCAKHDVRLHHVSTDEVFGDLPLDSADRFSTSTPYNPSSPYSASKAAADHIVRAWIRSFGLRATISNCSNNYGPNQHWEKLIPHTIQALLKGEKARIYGDGLNVRDWIHVNDHIDGIWLAIGRGQPGKTYLFGARDNLTNLEVVSSIVRELGRDEDSIEHVSDRLGHDLKYSIDPSFAESELGWQPKHHSLISDMSSLLPGYVDKWLRETDASGR